MNDYECPNCNAPLRVLRSGTEIDGYKCLACGEMFLDLEPEPDEREAYVARRIEEHEARGITDYRVGDFYEEYATRAFGDAQ